MDAEVRDNPQRSRYEIQLDGEVAGYLRYRLEPGRIALLHTVIESQFEGQGLGSVLVSGALDDARARELHVLPFCGFVNGYLKRHPEYVDLVSADQLHRFDLDEASIGKR